MECGELVSMGGHLYMFSFRSDIGEPYTPQIPLFPSKRYRSRIVVAEKQ